MISVNHCSRQVHQSQDNHGLKCLGDIMGGDIPKIDGTPPNTTIGGGNQGL